MISPWLLPSAICCPMTSLAWSLNMHSIELAHSATVIPQPHWHIRCSATSSTACSSANATVSSLKAKLTAKRQTATRSTLNMACLQFSRRSNDHARHRSPCLARVRPERHHTAHEHDPAADPDPHHKGVHLDLDVGAAIVRRAREDHVQVLHQVRADGDLRHGAVAVPVYLLLPDHGAHGLAVARHVQRCRRHLLARRPVRAPAAEGKIALLEA